MDSFNEIVKLNYPYLSTSAMAVLKSYNQEGHEWTEDDVDAAFNDNVHGNIVEALDRDGNINYEDVEPIFDRLSEEMVNAIITGNHNFVPYVHIDGLERQPSEDSPPQYNTGHNTSFTVTKVLPDESGELLCEFKTYEEALAWANLHALKVTQDHTLEGG